ncbi:MAG: nucleotide exchange factor GrpE [Coriobacteriales bacterium]|jgi:molecular chaperone GrpE|nr:nucleotide exchange factor GrpE [Coriobacteriales bacterium]
MTAKESPFGSDKGAAPSPGGDEAKAAAQAAADAAAVDEVIDELEAVEAEMVEELDDLGKAQAEANELRDKFVRLQAEWDNFRKRTAAERTQERARATERLVEKLLPIVDDLERAIEHSDTANETSLKEGIAAVYNKLEDVLTREGLKAIDPKGAIFDANLHQAVGKEEDATVPDETVTQVYQKGYELGDRILRPAMVVVSTGGPRADEKPAS